MLGEDRDWVLRGLCHDRDPRDYDLEDGQQYKSKKQFSHARSLCLGCPVLVQCAQDALDNRDIGVVRAGIPLTSTMIKSNRRRLQEVVDSGQLGSDAVDEADKAHRERQRAYQMRLRWKDRVCQTCQAPLHPAGSDKAEWPGRVEASNTRICVYCAEFEQIGA